ncbi:alpha/beta hydrolase [uncultured Imperialibacter sp.]|uniref:alpha/beta fold hydrolase n=1 Tax=uncultured Imperialibacter sp. TaxID=1672639 RepID=UPI0030DD9482|tara:strand:- start:26723 stop:27709 length:987 start_codon:yes stop_codon:yes gene_type:complete
MKKILILMICSALFACSDDTTDVKDTFYLRNEGADMPIWVRGNLDADKIVIFFHGGPGDCAMCYRYYLKGMESEIAVAYWDQRIAGSSAGNADPASLTYEQFGEDAFFAVSLLRQQYPGKKIYIMAHSFGVELAWQFLTTGENQKMVDGLLVVNGTFSNLHWMEIMREWVVREAAAQEDNKTLEFAETHPVNATTVNDVWVDYYRKMLELNGNPLSLYENKKFVLNYVLFSPNTAMSQFAHGKAYKDYSEKVLFTFDKTDELSKITLPVKFLWGKKDGVVPIEVGYETEALLTETTVDWTMFDDSWHEPFVSEKDKFIEAALSFVKSN